MTDDDVANRHLSEPADPSLTLSAEYRLFVRGSTGTFTVHCESEDEAQRLGHKLSAVWWVEKRMCGPWMRTGPARQMVETVVDVDEPEGDSMDGCSMVPTKSERRSKRRRS
jgi:hypothetical protein